jgi:hypothetical protein
MTEADAAALLNAPHDAPSFGHVAGIRRFGLRHADDLAGRDRRAAAALAALSERHGTESCKGMALAPFVRGR